MNVPEDRIEVLLSWRDVKDVAGALAELSIAVQETGVVEQDEMRRERLERATRLFSRMDDAFRLRERATRAVAELRER